jgi:hypothetical protein
MHDPVERTINSRLHIYKIQLATIIKGLGNYGHQRSLPSQIYFISHADWTQRVVSGTNGFRNVTVFFQRSFMGPGGCSMSRFYVRFIYGFKEDLDMTDFGTVKLIVLSKLCNMVVQVGCFDYVFYARYHL